jgi:hypothetical protein
MKYAKGGKIKKMAEGGLGAMGAASPMKNMGGGMGGGAMGAASPFKGGDPGGISAGYGGGMGNFSQMQPQSNANLSNMSNMIQGGGMRAADSQTLSQYGGGPANPMQQPMGGMNRPPMGGGGMGGMQGGQSGMRGMAKGGTVGKYSKMEMEHVAQMKKHGVPKKFVKQEEKEAMGMKKGGMACGGKMKYAAGGAIAKPYKPSAGDLNEKSGGDQEFENRKYIEEQRKKAKPAAPAPKPKMYAKGGMVRADGVAQRGKTKCKMR